MKLFDGFLFDLSVCTLQLVQRLDAEQLWQTH